MLNNSLILIFSVIALFAALLARMHTELNMSAPLFLVSFLCAVFCVTYAFLLGVDIEQILTYIIAFTLFTATVFWTGDDEPALLVKSRSGL